MYTDSDLTDAVQAGVLTPQTAADFRAFIAHNRAPASADEEQFRLLTGFNDIFVSIATILVLVGVGFVGDRIASATGTGLADAATAWVLALYFTARRRMALPSIVLLFGFLLGLAYAVLGLIGAQSPWWLEFHKQVSLPSPRSMPEFVVFAVAAVVTLGAWLHWRRFKVPITIACTTATTLFAAATLVIILIPGAVNFPDALTLIAGLATFAYAMRWDLSDPTRTTYRADVAFWLHLLAAPLIVHPIFAALHLIGGVAQPPTATLEHGAIAVVLYLILIIVSLAVDRRAFLASALIYVVVALNEIFHASGVVSSNLAVIGLAIGAALLFLSAFWPQSRAQTLRALQILHVPKILLDRLPQPR
ncbi:MULTISPECIES: hypothetical protein [Acidiphilium]|uniref:hypothetical protein n=1 Tax=Acidiphilium TaxID=522 RepID=UPI000BDBE86D|nr:MULTISPECIES: hypothetical protein [Acidiphilium]OZB23493.1 MAG: hypothetical protein B7X49_15865 [Acidiphilium sp. 34-64-41]HQT86701.1 hypothetical protein [Acidiphilium rubrum]